MASLDQQVAQIKARIASQQQEAARAEAQRAQAQAARDAALAALAEEFGAGSLEEAKALLVTLEEQALAECRRVAEMLSQAQPGI